MIINEGKWDRIARMILGVAIMALAVVGPKTPWGLLGLIPFLTGAIGFCPLYRLVGVDTCKAR
jgi:hypothetical protein